MKWIFADSHYRAKLGVVLAVVVGLCIYSLIAGWGDDYGLGECLRDGWGCDGRSLVFDGRVKRGLPQGFIVESRGSSSVIFARIAVHPGERLRMLVKAESGVLELERYERLEGIYPQKYLVSLLGLVWGMVIVGRHYRLRWGGGPWLVRRGDA